MIMLFATIPWKKISFYRLVITISSKCPHVWALGDQYCIPQTQTPKVHSFGPLVKYLSGVHFAIAIQIFQNHYAITFSLVGLPFITGGN